MDSVFGKLFFSESQNEKIYAEKKIGTADLAVLYFIFPDLINHGQQLVGRIYKRRPYEFKI